MSSIIIEGRVDPKDFASVIFAYMEHQVSFSSKSEALRLIMHDLALTLRQVGAKEFTSDEEAIHYLISTGMVLKSRQLSEKSISEALIKAKVHISTPAPPIDLDPSEVRNILSSLIDKGVKV